MNILAPKKIICLKPLSESKYSDDTKLLLLFFFLIKSRDYYQEKERKNS